MQSNLLRDIGSLIKDHHVSVHEGTYTPQSHFDFLTPPRSRLNSEMQSTDSRVLGVVVLARHGDRQGEHVKARCHTHLNYL